MSVKLMSSVYDARFWDIQYQRQVKKRDGQVKTVVVKVLAHTAKSVCLALADHANDDGKGAYPGLTKLEDKTELSRQSVVHVLGALKHAAIITYAGLSEYGTNNYSINKKLLIEMALRPRQERKKVVKPLDPGKAALPELVKPLTEGSKAALLKPSFNHPLTNGRKAPASVTKNLPLEWKLTHNLPVTEADFQDPAATALLDRVQAYPPDVQQILTWLVEIFAWPDVPARPARESKGGAYALWINDLRDIDKIIAGHGRKALEAAYRVWDKSRFTVSHPGALYSTIFDQVSRLNKSAAPAAPVASEPTPFEIALQTVTPGQRPPMPESLRHKLQNTTSSPLAGGQG